MTACFINPDLFYAVHSFQSLEVRERQAMEAAEKNLLSINSAVSPQTQSLFDRLSVM
jgi:hypothetical protein